MNQTAIIALVGDRAECVTAHVAIPHALEAARAATGSNVGWRWLGTDEVATTALDQFAGFWLVPGSPYRSFEGALSVVRFARQHGVPFLGTCGGFQHAVIEFARNVAGLKDADHAENNPNAATPVIAPLACSLVEVTGLVRFNVGSRLHAAYGTTEAMEGYHCRFGLNENHRATFEAAGFHFTACDEAMAVRGGELPEHPFFVGTLFQSERRALREEPVPLVTALLTAVNVRARARNG